MYLFIFFLLELEWMRMSEEEIITETFIKNFFSITTKLISIIHYLLL
jgi:hypothetical protein